MKQGFQLAVSMLAGIALAMVACDGGGGSGDDTSAGDVTALEDGTGSSETQGGDDIAAGPETTVDTPTPSGTGVNATGTYAGKPVEFHCQPPSDYSISLQFIHVEAGGIDKWAFTCPTADGTILLKFEVVNPEKGKAYAQPTDLDAFGISIGEPMDIQPPGKYATNLVEMKATVTELDSASEHLAGTLNASWSDDGSGKYGEVQGSFDVAPWK